MVKYLLLKSHDKAFVYFSLVLLFSCFQLNAQRYTFSFTHIPVSEALLKVSEQLNVKVAFDAQKLSTVFINKEITGNTAEELISKILSDTPFGFQFKHQHFLVFEKNDRPADNIPTVSELIGSITDRETGEQLPYATVTVLDQNLDVAASSTGSFSIKNIQSNPVSIGISFIGYYPLDTAISWTNTSWNADFRLSRKPQIIDSVVVKGVKLEMVDFRDDIDFATTINPSKLIDLPALTETDIFKTLQLLPGISYISNSSELSIRGGSSDQNLVLFDGQTLYNLSHYYGVISSINPNVIKDIQVFKGGYDSRYGERVSGIVDITGKSGNQLKSTIYGDLNLISGNVAAEIPIGNKLTVVAAFRRSYSDIYATQFANNLFADRQNSFTQDPAGIKAISSPSFYFYDFNTKLTYRFSNTNNLSVSFYGGKDFLDNKYGGQTQGLDVNTSDWNNWNNFGMSARWMKQWNSSYYSTLQIGASGYANEYFNSTEINRPPSPDSNPAQDKYLPDQTNSFNAHDKNKLSDISASYNNTYHITNYHQLNFGFQARRNSIYYYKDADKIYVYDSIDQSSMVSSFYFLDRFILFKNLTLKPGFRLNIYSGNLKPYLEPRFSANYRFSDKFSVRLATGRYCQFINQVLMQQTAGYNKSFWILADQSSHPVLTSTHFILGSTYEFGKFLFDAEAYYKNYNGLQEYIYISQYIKNGDFSSYFPPKDGPATNPIQQPSYYVEGKGKSYGIDFFFRYKTKGYTSWLSYSLSKSTRQFSMLNNNKEMPSPTDQTHQVSWTNMFSFGKWNFGAITLFTTGRPYLDNTHNNQDMLTVRYYKRLPDFFRADLSSNYNFRIRNARLKIGATVINIFNTTNYFDVNTRKFDFENTSFAETNLIQSQGLTLNLFLHFLL